MSDNNNDEPDFRELYKRLLEDPNFEKLETELQKPNIFSILGIGRAEIRHSNFLAWLLDPNESHGLGNRFLIRILQDLSTEENNLDIFEIGKLNFSDVEVNREVPISLENRNKNKDAFIDILIVFRDDSDKLVICIENKIDTTDSDEQLKNYRTYIENTFKEKDGYKNVFVYLTPNGTNPNSVDEVKWSKYSYKDGIIKHLEIIENSILDSTIRTYMSDYLSILKQEVMENKKSNIETIANNIFKDHRPVFEFVFKNKSNELYKLDWEKYSWVIKYAEKFRDILKEIDENIDDELGYTKTYISVKRNNQICYEFYSRERKPNCAMGFSFDKNKKDIVDKIEDELKKAKDKKGNYYSKDGAVFAVNEINNFIKDHDDALKKIHKVRFGIE